MVNNICGIDEISKYLNISVSEVRKLVRIRAIPFFRIGNRIKFNINSIDVWIEELSKKEERNSIFY